MTAQDDINAAVAAQSALDSGVSALTSLATANEPPPPTPAP